MHICLVYLQQTVHSIHSNYSFILLPAKFSLLAWWAGVGVNDWRTFVFGTLNCDYVVLTDLCTWVLHLVLLLKNSTSKQALYFSPHLKSKRFHFKKWSCLCFLKNIICIHTIQVVYGMLILQSEHIIQTGRIDAETRSKLQRKLERLLASVCLSSGAHLGCSGIQ